jgi:hypothetical protein
MPRYAKLATCLSACLFVSSFAHAQRTEKTVVFWQQNFPTIASQPIDQPTLTAALGTLTFADEPTLNQPATLADANLLILPYGSAVPTDCWTTIQHFVNHGGNLLILGGQPLQVPVTFKDGRFIAERPQDSYASTLGFRHTYEIPVPANAMFQWKHGFADPGEAAPTLKATHFFAVEGRLDGLGYMAAPDGQLVAAPIIFANRFGGSRVVALDFAPAPEFWHTPDAAALIRRAANFAPQGAAIFSIEIQFATLRPGEVPILSLHLHPQHASVDPSGEVKVELISNHKTLETLTLPIEANQPDVTPLRFKTPLAPGFYEVAATWEEHDQIREFYRNGFWVSAAEAVQAGPTLGADADTLTRNGQPFLPVGTNYFGTEENGWDFSGPRNAAGWENDFAQMQAHGVSFVRTGVCMPNARFIDGDLGGVNERFLRNLEAFLLSAQHHNIAVNFTFFAFSPKSGPQRPDDTSTPAQNPYLDPGALYAEESYIRSVVSRFRKVPFLCWDLINEPSFSNPRNVFKGNYPNNDPAELSAWRKWLRDRYQDLAILAEAWSTTPEDLNTFDFIPLPAVADLTYDRYANPRQVRALDYNLFAQEMFRNWVKSMVTTIHETGSTQLVDVGQDEGGVTNRVLNQFYAPAGLSFTTNHTYWEDDSLLWDSVAAKVPGIPNITGETGYQPAWAPDGGWRYDEITGLGLTERKWALGFAAGSSGTMQWDWAREVDFGMLRSDGSAKQWENMMRDLGAFATAAAPHAHGLILPEIAIVLPQSLQMSVYNNYALEAQQTAVRALYQQAHGAAYAVGEYQSGKLGTPKLILLPSPLGLTDTAWSAIEARVRAGATLLVTGPFDADAHLHPTSRAKALGLDATTVPLDLREQTVHWPGGDDLFSFPGKKTTVLLQATLPGGEGWKEIPLGQGRILFTTLPLELSTNHEALGRVYAYAMHQAGVAPTRAPGKPNPGILVCPTEYADATLYVLTSETQAQTVSFIDRRSKHTFSTTLAAGHAALLMVGVDGKIISSYNWHSTQQ